MVTDALVIGGVCPPCLRKVFVCLLSQGGTVFAVLPVPCLPVSCSAMILVAYPVGEAMECISLGHAIFLVFLRLSLEREKQISRDALL